MSALTRQTVMTGASLHQPAPRQEDAGLPQDVIREATYLSTDAHWPAWQVLLGVLLFCGGFWAGLFYVVSALFG